MFRRTAKKNDSSMNSIVFGLEALVACDIQLSLSFFPPRDACEPVLFPSLSLSFHLVLVFSCLSVSSMPSLFYPDSIYSRHYVGIKGAS